MENREDKNIIYAKVKKEDGKSFLKAIRKEFKSVTLINHQYKIQHEKEFILFPLKGDEETLDNLTKIIDKRLKIDLIHQKAITNPNYKYKTLAEALENIIPPQLIKLIPKSYDTIGDIAIVGFENLDELDAEAMEQFKEAVAKALIQVNERITTVYEKKSEVHGEFRLRDLKLLHGENKSETTHKENKCCFKLDVKSTYFSPRLNFERKRVSKSEIKDGELVVDMFAGVGPFSIQIARHHNVKVYSFDKNPDAFYYLNENIRNNKLKGEIYPFNMDIREVTSPGNDIGANLQNKVDRVIMNLPDKSLLFLDIACFLLKKSGSILHLYQFLDRSTPIKSAISNLNQHLSENSRKIQEIIHSKAVKPFSPKYDLVVIDAKILQN